MFQELGSDFIEARAKRKSLITQINVSCLFLQYSTFFVEIFPRMDTHMFCFLALCITLPLAVKSSEKKEGIESSASVTLRHSKLNVIGNLEIKGKKFN